MGFGPGRFIVQSRCDLSRCNMPKNNLKKIRESLLLSKAELARKAGISPITIDRVEEGHGCRMDTMRNILQALGLKLTQKNKVFLD